MKLTVDQQAIMVAIGHYFTERNPGYAKANVALRWVPERRTVEAIVDLHPAQEKVDDQRERLVHE